MKYNLLAASLACLISSACNRAPQNPAPSPGARRPTGVPVRVARAVVANVPLAVSAIGNVEAYSSVAMKSRVAGLIQKVFLSDGQDVKEGDVLFQLDSIPFEEQVRLAEANVARDQAAGKQAEASAARDAAVARNARQQADRQLSLFQQGIVARESAEQYRTTAEAAEAALAADQAAVESAGAAMRADQARLAEARLQMGYTTIRAPIGGRAGFIAIKEGNLVKENDTVALVVIHRVQPVYLTFAVPEQLLAEIRRYMAAAPLTVEAIDETVGKTIATGKLTSIDNAVDTTTGTIRLKATFPNADRALWPGQFVAVRMQLRLDRGVLTIPSQAVQTGLNGTFAWVVKGDGTVESRNLKVARTHKDLSVIAGGLEAGETVVTDGQLRLRKGARAEILSQP